MWTPLGAGVDLMHALAMAAWFVGFPLLFVRHVPGQVVSNDWFTVRIARAVFGMAPSRHFISRLTEALVLVTAAVIISVVRPRRPPLSSAA